MSKGLVFKMSLMVFAIVAMGGCSKCSQDGAKNTSGGGVSSSGSSDSQVVAEVETLKITGKELDESIKADLYEMDKRIFRLKQRKLEDLVTDKILELQAKKENMDLPTYLKTKIADQLKVTEKEVNEFYEANKARMQGTKEETSERITSYLENKKKRDFYRNLLADAKRDKKINILLTEPPSPVFQVSEDDDPVLGGKSAKVVIVEFGDYECPLTQRTQAVIKQINENYKDQVRIVYRDFPQSYHPNAKLAAVAAECARDQNKYWEFHDKVFADIKTIKEEDLIKYAGELTLKADDFKACLKNDAKIKEVEKDVADAEKLGVKQTPTFFINGKMRVGVLTFAEFKEVIDAELK